MKSGLTYEQVSLAAYALWKKRGRGVDLKPWNEQPEEIREHYRQLVQDVWAAINLSLVE